METITAIEYVPAIIIIKCYPFEELGREAQERVYSDWLDSGECEDAHYREVEEMDSALYGVAGLLGMDDREHMSWYGNLDYVSFSGCDFYDAIEACGGVGEYGTTGDCYGWDLAAAFNAHVPELGRLAEAARLAEEAEEAEEPDEDGRRFGCYATMEAQDAYCAEFDRAMEDVAAAYRRMVDDSFDYYYCKEGAREFWNDCACDWYVEGRWFTVDGEDVTYEYNHFVK